MWNSWFRSAVLRRKNLNLHITFQHWLNTKLPSKGCQFFDLSSSHTLTRLSEYRAKTELRSWQAKTPNLQFLQHELGYSPMSRKWYLSNQFSPSFTRAVLTVPKQYVGWFTNDDSAARVLLWHIVLEVDAVGGSRTERSIIEILFDHFNASVDCL